MNKHSILFERKQKVFLSKGKGRIPANYIGTVLKNLEAYGFTLSIDAINNLSTLTVDEFKEFYTELIVNIKMQLGAHKTYNPMYPNFPAQVMEASEAELYTNAIVHYIGNMLGVNILPVYDVEVRPALVSNKKLTIIECADDDEFEQIFTNLMSAKTSISDNDVSHLKWYIKHTSNLRLPDTIPHKEILATVFGEIVLKGKKVNINISDYIKNATDVLRLATYLSDGDVSLAENTNYKSFKRRTRRSLMKLIDKCGNIAEDMVRHKQKWLRLGERIHPGEYKKAYPKAFEAFNAIRNCHVSTFNARVEHAIKTNLPSAVDMLVTRPGEFARRLDHVLRLQTRAVGNCDFVIDKFSKVAVDVSTPVLLQLYSHFLNRGTVDKRTVIPKGKLAKLYTIDVAGDIPQLVCRQVANICFNAVAKRVSDRPELGRVYIDESLKTCNIPSSQRSSSKAFRTLTRGTRMDIGEGNFIRLFQWWKGCIDVDLTGVLLDENWNYISYCSYTKIKCENTGMYHSGDITTAPSGASEFIDIDIDKATRKNARYLVMNVYAFYNINFSDMQECFVGWMMREDSLSGEIYEPSTVQNKIDLTACTRTCVPVVFDLVKRQVIWCDMTLSTNGLSSLTNNIECNGVKVADMCEAIVKMRKTSLYDLFHMHVVGRNGVLTAVKDEADTVFSLDEGITPYDTDIIISEYM
jgi:hypothetical protein